MCLSTRILFAIIFILMFHSSIIETAKCSCRCCSGSFCEPETLPSMEINSCSMCKNACNAAYPTKCGRAFGITISSCHDGLSTGASVGIIVGIIVIIVIVVIIGIRYRRRLNYTQRLV